MGEIAEDMIDGTCCSLCGQYFDSGNVNDEDVPVAYTHGYPVACWDCFEPGIGYQKSLKPTF